MLSSEAAGTSRPVNGMHSADFITVSLMVTLLSAGFIESSAEYHTRYTSHMRREVSARSPRTPGPLQSGIDTHQSCAFDFGLRQQISVVVGGGEHSHEAVVGKCSQRPCGSPSDPVNYRASSVAGWLDRLPNTEPCWTGRVFQPNRSSYYGLCDSVVLVLTGNPIILILMLLLSLRLWLYHLWSGTIAAIK